jgi:hypothetical protein
MLIRVIQLVSIGMCLTAMGMNILGVVRNERVHRQLVKALGDAKKLIVKLDLLCKEKSENSENEEREKNYEEN